MKRSLTILIFSALSAFACEPTSGWVAFTPRIAGLNNVTITDGAYAVDSDCTASIRVSFKGTAPGNSYAVFTLPIPFPINMALAVTVFAGNQSIAGAVVPWTDAIHLNVFPFDGRIPSSGELDDYRISGSFHTP